MLWQRITAYFQGYLVVKISGSNLEKLVNQIVRRGVNLWEIRRISLDMMVFKIAGKDLKLIRRLLRQANCRGKVLARLGWPFFWQGFSKKRGWLIGMVLFFLIVYTLASFILFIRIEGTGRISAARVMADLNDLGLYPGVIRGRIEDKRDWVIREMRIRYPEAAWISLEIKGVVAQVRIVEKTIPPAGQGHIGQDSNRQGEFGPLDTGHLYAAKDGLVTKVVVIEGTSQVQQGDTVSRGDLLILGQKVLRKIDGTVETSEVKAVGVVEARVWYEIRVEEPLLQWCAEVGEEKKTVYRLRVNRRVFPLFSLGRTAGNTRVERERFKIYQGRNRLSLVELVKDTYHQVTWVKRSVSPDTALLKARKEGRDKISRLLPSGIQPEKLQEDWEIKQGILSYRLVAETLENIAVDL